MASNYSDRLKLELMETGANANTWGNNTNTNLETLDAFSAGYLSKSVAGSANVTLTSNNADPTAESSNKVIEFTGTLTGDITVFIPAVESNYIFYNNTSGSYTLTVAPTGHGANGSAITQGAHTIQYCTGDTVTDLFAASLGNLSVVNNLSVSGVMTGNASGVSAINASNVSSGTIADARLTANVTLNNASTISAGTLDDSRLTANVTLNNASTISAGTLSNDRLDTVPTTKGGTGLTSVGSAGQVLTVSAPGALAFADAAGGAVGNVTGISQLTSPGNISTQSDSLFAIGVAVGGGGSGGCGGHGFGQGQGQPGQATTGGGLTGAAGNQGAAGFPNPGANGGNGGAGGGMLGGAGGNSGTPGSSRTSAPGGTNPLFHPYGRGGSGNNGSGETGGGGGAGGAYNDITGPYTRGATVSITVGAGGIGRPGNRGTGQPGAAGVFRWAEYYA
jgi:hypothetical protein